MPTNTPFGFVPCEDQGARAVPRSLTVATGATIKIGDPVYLDGSTGLVTIGSAITTRHCGVAASAVTSATAGDKILVYADPNLEFRVQASGAAVADAKLPDLFDLAGSTGAFTANLNAHTIGAVKVIGYESTGNYGIVRVKFARHQFDTSEGLTTDSVVLESGNIISNGSAGTVAVDADLQPLTLTAGGLVKGADLECTDDLTVGDAIVAAKYNLLYNSNAVKSGTFELTILPSGVVTVNNTAAAAIVQFASAVKGVWLLLITGACDGANTVKLDLNSSGGDLSYAGGGDITFVGAGDIGKVVLVVGDGTKFACRSL